MPSVAMLPRAQMAVAGALRAFPFTVRATLTVDPDDPSDVRLWIRRTLDDAQPGRFDGSPAAVVGRLRWTALDEARRARRRLPHGRDGHVLQMPDATLLDGVADRVPGRGEWTEALEDLVADVTAAAESLVSAAPEALRPRRATAVLACLARTVAAVRGNVGSGVGAMYVARLASAPAFLRLPLRQSRVGQFLSAMAILNEDGAPGPPDVQINLRHAVQAVGEPWAQPKHWRAFCQAVEQRRCVSNPAPAGLTLRPDLGQRPQRDGDLA